MKSRIDPRLLPYSSSLIILMALLLVCSQLVFAEDWEPLVEDLRDDNVRLNGRNAFWRLTRLIQSENMPGLREKLESLLEDPDYQMRQFVSLLLVNVYEREGVREAQWPEALMRNMVEGLREDWMNWGNTFANANQFAKPLFNLKENRPIEMLKAELKGGDPQSRFIAAILLSSYKDLGSPSARENKSDLTERNKVLLRHLLDDGVNQNAVAAYRALVRSGTENIRQLLEKFEPLDWQQAALIQCIASFHGVIWFPSNDDIREQWLEKARQPYTYRYGTETKFAIAAIYLDPQRERFLRGKEIPEVLNRVLKAGRNIKGTANRMKWATSWFPVLNPEQRYSFRSFSFIPFAK